MTTALELQYFGSTPATKVYRGTTAIELLRDGVDYFDAVDAEIAKALGPGDAIYMLCWHMDPAFDLKGRTGTAAVPLSQLLAEKASKGVDVRVIIWTGRILGDPSVFPRKNPMAGNSIAARTLRTQTVHGVSAPPLENRVLLDWSGYATGSHHQKMVLVISGNGSDMVAFVAGIDPWVFRRDEAPHTSMSDPADGSPFGWHDMGIALHGEAALGVYNAFIARWRETVTLPPKKQSVPGSFTLEPMNPSAPAPLPSVTPAAPAIARPKQAVQVLRSRWGFKYGPPASSLLTYWDDPPGGTSAIVEIFTTLKEAILGAKDYIYIEDQYLDDNLTGDPFSHYWTLIPYLASVAKLRDVKLIFLGSGRGDPNDVSTGPQNTTFDGGPQKIATQLTAAGVDPKSRIALWRLKPATVHSKCILIDDRFAAIGSANIMSRSMSGEDSELQVAFVDEGDLIRDFRIELWAEHHNIPEPRSAQLTTALQNIETARGLWRADWLPASSPDLWSAPGKPPGFGHLPNQIEFVGPS